MRTGVCGNVDGTTGFLGFKLVEWFVDSRHFL